MGNQQLNQFLNLCTNPYLLLTLSVVSIFVSVTDNRPIAEIFVIGLFNIVMILIALRGARTHHLVFSKTRFFSLFTLIVISLIWDIVFYLSPPSFKLKSAFFIGAALIRFSIFAYGWLLLAKTLAAWQRVTNKTVVTAILGYLFIGIIHAFVYYAIWQVDPQSLHISMARDYEFRPWNLVMYFSFMTLTTVGYGDILPINKWIMALSNFEAMTGSIYLAVIIARLVSLYSAPE